MFNYLTLFFNRYAGETVDEKLIGDATHIVLKSAEDKLPEGCSKKVVKLTDEDLWNCIKTKKFDDKKFNSNNVNKK